MNYDDVISGVFTVEFFLLNFSSLTYLFIHLREQHESVHTHAHGLCFPQGLLPNLLIELRNKLQYYALAWLKKGLTFIYFNGSSFHTQNFMVISTSFSLSTIFTEAIHFQYTRIPVTSFFSSYLIF